MFLHGSSFDPYPNSILEAMSCGCIVVSSNLAGSAIDRINNGVNGVIFEYGNSVQLQEAIKLVYHFTDLEKEIMRGNARKTAEMWDYTFNLKELNNIIYD
jgi:glycosyltransferase involved in cell wall biosynthesis